MLFEYGYCKSEDMKQVLKELRKTRKANLKGKRTIEFENDIDDE